MRRAATLGLLCCAFIGSRAARADAPRAAVPAQGTRETIAVLVFGGAPNDAALAENATEIIIGALARRGAIDSVGAHELRRLTQTTDDGATRRCLEDTTCASRTAAMLGVRRFVTGTVSERPGRFVFTLGLKSAETGQIVRTVFRQVDGTVSDLIAALESATQDLFTPPVLPGRVSVKSQVPRTLVLIDHVSLGQAPLLTGPLPPGRHHLRAEATGRIPFHSDIDLSPGKTTDITIAEAQLRARPQWPRVAAYGTAIGAAVTGAAGAALGLYAQTNPEGATRAESQQAFEQRRRLGLVADVSLVTAAVLAATSVFLFYTHREQLFER